MLPGVVKSIFGVYNSGTGILEWVSDTTIVTKPRISGITKMSDMASYSEMHDDFYNIRLIDKKK